MKLSVIVPVYNCEKYLRECLHSVIAASDELKVINDKWSTEIICIDDCSTDGSGEILDELSAVYHSSLIVHHLPANAGVSAARNRGLEEATGDYVWFVDADDVIAADALVCLNEVFRKYEGVDIVHFDLKRFEREIQFDAASEDLRFFDLTKKADRRLAYRLHAFWLLGSSAVYRREVFGRMRFCGLKNGEDSVWGRRCFYRAKSLVRINRALYGYRQLATSAHHSWTKRHWDDYCRSSWLMCREGLFERHIWDFVLLAGLKTIRYAWIYRRLVK